MERLVLQRSAQGASDEMIAQELTEQGYRSPMQPFVLPSTVKLMRLRHGIFQVRHQSHPRKARGRAHPFAGGQGAGHHAPLVV